MENTIELNPQELQIQGLLDRYLASRVSAESIGPHIEDDILVAFVEGSISERESGGVVAHLVDCGFCRHTTAELIRFEAEFENAAEPVAQTQEPAKISQVLSGIFSKLFGSTEGAVFAHEQDAEKKKDADKSVETDSDKSDQA